MTNGEAAGRLRRLRAKRPATSAAALVPEEAAPCERRAAHCLAGVLKLLPQRLPRRPGFVKPPRCFRTPGAVVSSAVRGAPPPPPDRRPGAAGAAPGRSRPC